MKTLFAFFAISLLSLIFACSNINNINTVNNLNIYKYAGKWYEIARLPNPYEKNLHDICTFYSLQKDNKINIMNLGFDENNKIKIATAIAYPVNKDYAKMRVCFQYPFHGDYAVTILDDNHSYAVVESPPYLWILARKTKLDEKTLKDIITTLKNKNIDTSKLIYVEHIKSALDHPSLQETKAESE